MPLMFGIFSPGDSLIYNLAGMLQFKLKPEDDVPEGLEHRDQIIEIMNKCIQLRNDNSSGQTK